MLKNIYLVLENDYDESRFASLYDYAMMSLIFLSLLPLCFKQQTSLMVWIDRITVIAFIIDYSMRWMTSFYKNKTYKSYFYYPFTPLAIIDILSILPSLTILSPSLKLFRLLRLARTLKVFKALKLFRYSKSIAIIINVLKNSRKELIAVGTMAIAYILISALAIFNIEPNTFNTFFDAVYWATISLTTVGYGDIYPVSTVGRCITMASSFLGIAVVALPAGIITAGYMNEIKK